MNRLFLAVLLVGTLIFIGSCCQPCEGENLGDFPLQNATFDWLTFADGEPRLFLSNTLESMTLTYEPLVRNVLPRNENCREQDNCGLCCDEFQAEIATTRLVSSSGDLVFEFVMEKDYISNDISTTQGELSDRLLITLNGQIRCDILNIPDASPTGRVELRNQTFSGVTVCETPEAVAGPLTRNIFAYYFSPTMGIVGFVETDGTEWSLEL